MQLLVVMDPLAKLKPYKDTTVAMLKSAKDMAWSVAICTPRDIYCSEGQAFARVSDISIGDEHSKDWARTSDLGDKPLTDFDIILMRKDPPFDMEYIYTTYALELAQKKGVLVANKPQSLRDANEKFFTLNFPQCCPTTLVSSDIARLKDFWKKHKNVIFKPLEGMGGNSVFHIDSNGGNLSVVLEVLTKNQTLTIMAQVYIPDISKTGDKRILMINGQAAPYALARIPAKGELRGNLAAGAQGKVVALTDRDRWIAEQVGPTLLAKGLYFVGLDVIGDYLTEINVTSPTCLREICNETGLDLAGDYLRGLAKVVSTPS
ncbi:MAG: glutathione synthase [Legionella sp.]|jgi:glutathione synthase